MQIEKDLYDENKRKLRQAMTRVTEDSVNPRQAMTRVTEDSVNSRQAMTRVTEDSVNPRQAITRVIEYNVNPRQAMTRVTEDSVNPRQAMTRVIEHNVNPRQAMTRITDNNVNPRTVERSIESCNYLGGQEANLKEIIKTKNQINPEDDKIKQFNITTEGNLYLKMNQEIIIISNFSVSPNKILIKDDGLNKEILYILTCILNNNEERKTISLCSNELNSFEWIKKKLGIKYYIVDNIKAYKYLEIFISEKFKSIKEEIEYVQVGWRLIDNTWVYLHGGGAIGLDNNSTIKGSKDKAINVLPNISFAKALSEAMTMLSISDDLHKTLPLFLYSHLAVMKQLFIESGVEPKFVLWIYGLTGSMKTSISKVFFNLFNRGGREHITSTFKDTLTAIEIKSFEYKDSTLLIDDFHPTTSSVEKRDMERIASEMLRRYGDGICRARSTKNLTRQKEFQPRGLCVITGEDNLGGASTVARYIGIEVTEGDFISEKLLYHQNNPLILSTHMHNFIYWISKNFESLKNSISQQFGILRNENLGFFKHKRFVESFTLYNIVCDIFLQYCMYAGVIDYNEKQKMRKDWNIVIYDVIRAHELSNLKEDPAIMYIMALQELVSSNKCKLLRKNENSLNKTKIIGYFDEEKYYLFKESAFSEIRGFWKNLGIEFPVSSDQANKALEVLDIIETKIESGKKRRTLKITGHGNERFLVININKMTEVLTNIN